MPTPADANEAYGEEDDDDADGDVTLYLHIYENALSCSPIWLVAGRNWGGGEEKWPLQCTNCIVKYVRVVHTYTYIPTLKTKAVAPQRKSLKEFLVLQRHK